MKKPTRAERRALIEKGKNVAIIALCLCCVALLYSIWDLYKGQVSIAQVFWGAESSPIVGNTKTEDVVNSFRGFTEPDLIMVGQSNARAVLKADDELYVRAVMAVNEVMKSLYNRQTAGFEATDRDLWQNVISNGIIYAQYPCEVSTSFEKPFVTSGESGMDANIKKYTDVMIVPHPSAESGVTVFVQDRDTLQTFKVELEHPAKELRSIISGCQYKKNNSLVFAHELNLDAPKDNDGAVVLDSMFIIPLEDVAVSYIVTNAPDAYTQGIGFSHTNDFTTGLLNVFGYNPNTVRQYAIDDGTVIFVGDTGSLSLHPDGMIEYKALGENEGVSFITTGRNQADSRGVMSGLSGIINAILSDCGVNSENSCASLRITEMPDMSNPSELRICMEYFADNRKVLLGNRPAVEALIKNGVLVELCISIKTIQKTEKITSCGDAFSAIDKFCEKNPNCKSIKKGQPVYVVLEDGKETSATWQIQGE